jgi:hypothetical protein
MDHWLPSLDPKVWTYVKKNKYDMNLRFQLFLLFKIKGMLHFITILNINWKGFTAHPLSSISSILLKNCIKWSDVSFIVKWNLTLEVILLTFSQAVKVHQMYECSDRNSALEGHAKSIPSSMQKSPKLKVHPRLLPVLGPLDQWFSNFYCYGTLLVIKYFLGTLETKTYAFKYLFLL